MTEMPDFLPPILDLQGTWGEILERLYAVFCRDFKKGAVHHQGIRIIYDSRVLPDGCNKEEGFWHVVSKEDRSSGERLIDYRRAERLPWAWPTMQSPERSEIKVFDYDHVTKDIGIRRYIWLAEYDYVLILQRKKKVLFWITAYYVDSERRRRDLSRRYEKRL
ncbi:MAG: hypothetical protein ABIE47_06060 [Pseudomonadota bacterium]